MLTRHLNANSHKARLPITPRQERAKNCGIPRGAGNVVAKKTERREKGQPSIRLWKNLPQNLLTKTKSSGERASE